MAACCMNRRFMENCREYTDVPYNTSCLVCLYDKTNVTNISRIAQVFTYNETTGERILQTANATAVTTPSDEYFQYETFVCFKSHQKACPCLHIMQP